jgi:serine/threonine protein kinase
MPRGLRVIDGANQGEFFPLPEKGTLHIGNTQHNADIRLNDLYVARLHCRLDVEGERVEVTANDTPAGTLINGQKVSKQELRLGEVLRVGNSHLRLEVADAAAPAPSSQPPAKEPPRLPVLPFDRLDELTGHKLGHFEVGTVLGRGHHGVVFRAHDLKTAQAVALKVLAPEFPKNDAEMQQFARVLKTRLALRHPNLVTLYGGGKTGPYCWLALEHVEGDSAAHLVAQQRAALKAKAGGDKSKTPLRWRSVLRIATHLARALVFLREQRLLHGNITPRNVLVQASDALTRLNDLLFLKALEGSRLAKATLEKKYLAELAYLAPEQLDTGAYVDDLSDQYSVGAVLYALLSGKPPFAGDTPEETIRQIREEPPPRPRTGPDELQAVVLKMLAKHQEERFTGPAELLAELERVAAEHSEAG